MLGRKQSLRGELLPYEVAQEETNNESVGVDWMNKLWMKRLLRMSALLCLCSVSLNTPKTFELYPFLRPITFACDLITGLLFTAEMVVKINTRTLLKGEDSYLRDRWCLFDTSMLFFLWISVILQALELTALVSSAYSYLSILRSPRPLIMIRFIRVFLKFSMPKSRINQIFKRSGQQIYNVTLFFLFFMSLYGLLGVQFFGELRNHCILNDTDFEHITVNSLTIPDTYCSMDSTSGYQCPEGTVCIKLKDSRYKLGFNGFDEIATSIFTVYQAFSQEGWVFIMYRAVDTLPAWRAFMYFTTMIFFLSWLVKNVFIAVITETFNEIRVQFQQMWGQRGSQLADIVDARAPIISGDDRGWKLVPTDATRHQYRTVLLFLPVLNSAAFHLLLMAAILANGLFTASMSFKHDGRPRSDFYQQHYYIEVGFTVFFNLEALFKMWCLGFRDYYGRTIYKFELLLVIGTTLHLLPQFYLSVLTYFQVLRVVRLIKASPLLEDFVYKIFGPGKKLGSLIIFTMCLLIITSSISMQLFCFLADFTKFETFPEAFMSMFQILTQEAWVEVMDETMLRTSETIVPIVAVYFILYHLFVTLIVLSLFVAVILDNLELDEDIKKLKQMKAREQSAEIKKTLPRRLRLFEKFPDRPQMTRLHKVPSDFNLPKVRDSFVRQFMLETGEDEDLPIDKNGDDNKGNSKVLYRKKQPLRLLNSVISTYVTGTNQKQNAITGIINESNNQRLLLGDSGPIPIIGTGKQGAAGQKNRQDLKKGGHRSFRGSVKIKQTYEHLKENGDLGAMNRTSTSRRTPDIDIKLLQAKRQQAEMRRNQREEDLRENHPYFDTPLFLVPRESGFRRLCQRLVYARYCPRLKDPITGKERKLHYKRLHNLVGLVTYLDWVMIFVTTLSCLSMMFETPRYRLCDHRELQIAEFGFVIFMSLELGLKILADGLFFTPKALFKDAAGILDLFTFAVGLAMLCWMPKVVPQNSSAQLLLLLRCLRPLRIFILVPHMRKVVCELCRGFKEILLVSILLIVLMFVFASYGVQLYGGRLARCNDSEIKNRDQCVGVFLRKVFVTKMKLAPGENETHPAILVPRVWANPRRFNFDSIGNAMLALFEVLSFKGWLDIRDVLIKTLGPVHAIYIHIFVFLGCMIGLTLFVGVVIANYSENKGTALLTVDQRRWCDLKKRLKIAQPLHLPPRPEGHRFRAFIYDITQHIYFKRFIALMVILNSSLLCVSWREDQAHTSLLATISSCLSFVFVAEVSMKMIAFTPHGYWQSRRNRYDTLVTVMGLVWAITNYTMGNDLSHSFGFVAIILRFFTITGKHATLKMLMLTVVVSVYKSFFIIMGMFLLIFVYALTGCLLFGTVKYGESVGRQANFGSTPRGIIMLFRIVTGEDWYKIMHDCMVLPPFCTPGANYWETDCGNFTAAMIFFCSFYVIITYIVLNLLVAIIMENFSLFYSNEEDALLSYADIRNFQNTWNIVDVNQRGVIPVRKVKFVLRLLKGRLEVDPQKDRLLFKHMCFELERLHNGEDVTFHDVLNMLSYRSVDIRKSLQLEELLAREELEYIIEEEVAKQTIRQWLDSCLKRMKTVNTHDTKEHNSLLAGLRATNDQLQEAQEEKNREFSAGGAERDTSEVKQEAEGSGKHRRKGMLVTRSDSINSVSGRRLFYAPCHGGDGTSQQRSTYDKERLGVSSNPKKRPSRQSTGKGIPSSSFSHSGGECSPGASPTCPTTGGQHGLIFPYSSIGGGTASSNWSNRGSGHPLPPLAPPSALAVRVASAVTEVQDWWRDQLASPDGSDED